MSADYFLGSQHLARGGSLWWDETTPAQTSIAYFCPTCGEIWGRVLDSRHRKWHVLTIGCERHPSSTLEPGGQFRFPWLGVTQDLPLPVLEREFHLWYEHHVKEE